MDERTMEMLVDAFSKRQAEAIAMLIAAGYSVDNAIQTVLENY